MLHSLELRYGMLSATVASYDTKALSRRILAL